jgi:hypothetical protein
LIEENLSSAAEGIVSSQLDPWVTALGFCEALLSRIEDFLCSVSFDVMKGPDEHMSALQQLLQKAGYRFSWRIDADANVVHFKFEDIEWEGPRVDAWWAHEPPFSKNEPNLIEILQKHGWYLFVAGTGDATIRYLLVPPNSKEVLKKYLVPGVSMVHPDYDPRVDWLYEGISEEFKSENFWEI